MKILFTQDALINAGAEKSHLEIISRFSAETEAAFVYFYPRHDLLESYQVAGIRLFFLDIAESYHFPLAISRLVKLIREEKPNLLVSCLWRADIITRIASLITGVPLVGTLVNDSYVPISWKDKKGWKHQVVYWLDRLTSGIPIHWISNAQALVDSHVKTLGINPKEISVIYRGREVPEISLRLVQPIRNFISYGRLLERKGFQEAIQAFSEVVKHYPDCTLTIYGEGVFRRNLEDLISSLNLQTNVKLPGRVANPTDLLITENCFLFPSWYEGFSGALVEAMMAGIPIIASDIPMNLEAIEADHSALVFPVGNTKVLEEKMNFAIEHPDLMLELGNQARVVANKKFDINVIAKQYEKTLVSVYYQTKSKGKR